jgi:prolycopene isomerase
MMNAVTSTVAGTVEARADAYDVIVIGGGMGGLTAGALLARAGKHVLVVDANGQPGGYTRAIVHGPYTFDMADHLISGCAPQSPIGPGVVDAVLSHLGVRDHCQFIRVADPFYEVRFPDLILTVPGGREAFIEAHVRRFASDARGLRRLVELSAEIAREAQAFPIAPGPADLLRTPWRFPALFRYRNATMQQMIDRELHDPRLKAAYATLWPWVGLPPARASFLFWAIMMGSFVEDGAYYCRGSFQRLADAVAEGLERAGGELLPAMHVTRIVNADGRVAGVVLDNGQRLRAPVVIAACDARDTYEMLLDPSVVPARLLRRLRAMELSLSVLSLYLATDLDARALGVKQQTFVYATYDAERGYAEALAGAIPGVSVTIPSLADPSLAPPSEHIVIVNAIAPRVAGAITPTEHDRLAARMLDLAESALPGLRDHTTYVAGAGPTTARFPLQQVGPIYGWAALPSQVGPRRLPQRTSVEGLFLAGQWTQPGPGIVTVMQSGVQAARLVAEIATDAGLLPLSLPARMSAA